MAVLSTVGGRGRDDLADPDISVPRLKCDRPVPFAGFTKRMRHGEALLSSFESCRDSEHPAAAQASEREPFV